jgi:hypothetical protein
VSKPEEFGLGLPQEYSARARSRLGLAKILIVEKSWSQTHLFNYLSRIVVKKYWKSGIFVKVLLHYCLGLETQCKSLIVFDLSLFFTSVTNKGPMKQTINQKYFEEFIL